MRKRLAVILCLFFLIIGSSKFIESQSKTKVEFETTKVVALVLSPKQIGSKTYLGLYFKQSDSCYSRITENVGNKLLRYFPTAKDAEAAGFTHSTLGINQLGKFCNICSRLYTYFWASDCEKILYKEDDEAEKAGLNAIEQFELTSSTFAVFAFEGGKLYYTPCDPEYSCIGKLLKNWEPLNCNQGMKETKILKFHTEKDARKAGYYPSYKYFYDEIDLEF